MVHKAYKFETQILPGGKLELTTPIPAGCRVEVLVIPEEQEDDMADMLDAASSSFDFWDNPIDDAEWNNA
jgi:hypothetical protein